MAKDELTQLSNLRAGEISVVRRGANKKKRFPIFKGEASMDEEMQEILKAVLETELEEEQKLAEVFKALSPKGMSAAKGALRILNAFKEEMPENVLNTLADLAGYPEPKKAQEKKPEEKEPKMPFPEKKDAVAKAANELPDEVKAFVEPLFKAYDAKIEALTEQTKASEERANKTEEVLKAERDERQLGEWITKAENQLAFYPGKSSEELGKMLHTLAKADRKVADEQFETMKVAAETIEKSTLLTDVGLKRTGSGAPSAKAGTSAWEQIEKMADGIVEKSSDGLMDKPHAVTAVLKTERGKELYAQYLAEHPSQTSLPPGHC